MEVEAAVLEELPPQAARPMASAETPATFMKLRRVILWIRIRNSLLFICFHACGQGGTPLRRFVQPDAAFRLRHVSLDDILTYQIDRNNTKRRFLSESLPAVPKREAVLYVVY